MEFQNKKTALILEGGALRSFMQSAGRLQKTGLTRWLNICPIKNSAECLGGQIEPNS